MGRVNEIVAPEKIIWLPSIKNRKQKCQALSYMKASLITKAKALENE